MELAATTDISGATSASVDGEGAGGRLERALLLCLGVWMGLCGGTLYAFSAWEVELMERCELSAKQLDTVYAFGQIGVGTAVLSGLLYDRCGVTWSCVYSMVLTVVGNVGLTLALSVDAAPGEERCGGLPLLCILYMVLQNGSVALFQAGLLTNQAAALPSRQGITVGIISAGNGLSAAFFAELYATVFGGSIIRYLRGTGLIFAITAACAAFVLPKLVKRLDRFGDAKALGSSALLPTLMADPNPLKEGRDFCSASAAGGRIYERLADEPHETPECDASVVRAHGDDSVQGEAFELEDVDKRGKDVHGALVAKLPLDLEATDIFAGKRYSQPLTASKGATSSTDLAVDMPIRQLFLSAVFWHSIGTFAVLQAVGSGVFMANLSLMSASFGMSEDQQLNLIRMVSLCSCTGRVFAGFVLDFSESQLGIPRAAHYTWTACLLVTSAMVLCLASEKIMGGILLPAIMLVGFAYGANWALMPSYSVWRFGGAHKGLVFNMHASAVAISVSFSSSFVGDFYDQAAAKQGADGFCSGSHCWEVSYGLALALSGVGLVSALILWARAACEKSPPLIAKGAAE